MGDIAAAITRAEVQAGMVWGCMLRLTARNVVFCAALALALADDPVGGLVDLDTSDTLLSLRSEHDQVAGEDFGPATGDDTAQNKGGNTVTIAQLQRALQEAGKAKRS